LLNTISSEEINMFGEKFKIGPIHSKRLLLIKKIEEKIKLIKDNENKELCYLLLQLIKMGR